MLWVKKTSCRFRFKVLSPKILNDVYHETLLILSFVDDYIARTIVTSFADASLQLPNFDSRTVLEYIGQTAKKEGEANLNAGLYGETLVGN